MEIVACPDPACPAPARVHDRWTWPSTGGPVEHAQTGCEAGHWFTPTAATLTPFRPQAAPAPRRAAPPRRAVAGGHRR